MSVDKFGITEDDETIYPVINYAINLDNLANVEGFNNPGPKGQLYGLKLNERKMYERSEILPSDNVLDSLWESLRNYYGR